ncbi:MAG: 16S rRNA (guanine(527)-N(7))-methyltransferase RsmG [Treponema sp.]|nr:16S rRNA (guanine(527)-N(7))-methyltransferase RsmG [Treponema sp.]
MPTNEDILSNGLLALCQNDPVIACIVTPRHDAIITLLEQYITRIEIFNPALKLVGTNDRRDLIVKHILDSLSPLGIIACQNKGLHIADIGSGAGFPGIPLAIALPDIQFTLIERKNRRAVFLRNTREALVAGGCNGLSNVTVEEAEMEKVKPGRFSLVTFRALCPLDRKIYKKLSRLCTDGGVLAAYKGRRQKTEDEITALEKVLPFVAGRWKLLPCPVPMLDEERHLLLIKPYCS